MTSSNKSTFRDGTVVDMILIREKSRFKNYNFKSLINMTTYYSKVQMKLTYQSGHRPSSPSYSSQWV